MPRDLKAGAVTSRPHPRSSMLPAQAQAQAQAPCPLQVEKRMGRGDTAGGPVVPGRSGHSLPHPPGRKDLPEITATRSQRLFPTSQMDWTDLCALLGWGVASVPNS